MNDLPFVERAQTLLRARGIETWVFGGWGEELRGLIRPREHADLDLLYPAKSWARVDAHRLDWVAGKRRPWKRAFVLEGMTVELFLVQRDEHGWYTALARRVHRWPDNVFASNGHLRVASTAALASFRHSYRIDTAA
jgi:aminoglycoside-2''-adenylyltransferase